MGRGLNQNDLAATIPANDTLTFHHLSQIFIHRVDDNLKVINKYDPAGRAAEYWDKPTSQL